MLDRRTLTFDHPLLAGVELPCFEAHGATDGPRLCLMAGIHGAEYSSIAAVIRAMRALDTGQLRGSILAVPVVSITSYRARSAFVLPEDGKNLNRLFPGNPNGTFGDVLAHHLFQELIAPSDALLDLHGGDLHEELEPFAIYDESDVEERAAGIAEAFGLPYVIRLARSGAPVSGSTSGAAAAIGIPAVIAEAGGCGLLEESAVQLHLQGIENVLRHLEMLPGEPAPPAAGQRRVGRFVWLRCEHAGFWEPARHAGDAVSPGDLLGVVRDLHGEELERITAPDAGVLMFVTSSPAVADDGLLLGLGADVG
jgi:uncharacterized protein